MLAIPLGLKVFGGGVARVAKKIPLSVWLGLAGVFVLWGYGSYQHHRGKQEVQVKWDAAVARGKVAVKALQEKQRQVSIVTETIFKDRIKVIYAKGKVIHDKIPIYIPAGTPDLPGGFRVLHDAAATNTVPGVASGVKEAPVSVAEATSTIIDNYTGCIKNQVEVLSLQQWAAAQRQAYLELCKQSGSSCN